MTSRDIAERGLACDELLKEYLARPPKHPEHAQTIFDAANTSRSPDVTAILISVFENETGEAELLHELLA